MERKREMHIAAEVDPNLWRKFREKAFAENLTTGQLLDKIIAACLEIKQNYSQQSAPSSTAKLLEDIALEQEPLMKEDLGNETISSK
jgi:hypothetical protein